MGALPAKVVFACTQHAGLSQMAAVFFNRVVDTQRVRAISAGVAPVQAVHPQVVAVMREIDFDMSKSHPTQLTPELAYGAIAVITMGCKGECPVVQGAHRYDWRIFRPSEITRAAFRRMREDIRRRVICLVAAEGWGRG